MKRIRHEGFRWYPFNGCNFHGISGNLLFAELCSDESITSITNKNIPKTFRMISDYCIYCSNYLSSSHMNSIHFLIMLYVSLYMTLLKKGWSSDYWRLLKWVHFCLPGLDCLCPPHFSVWFDLLLCVYNGSLPELTDFNSWKCQNISLLYS